MELLALKLLVTEDDVNRLLAEHLPADVPVRKLAMRLTPDGVRVQGEYPTVFLNVAFDSLWTLAVVGGRIEVRLGELKVSGFPATMLRGVIFKVLCENTGREPGLTVEGETLRIDLEAFLAAKGLPLKTNLQGVACAPGSLVIEAGAQPVLA
jgi:hypothetical protein